MASEYQINCVSEKVGYEKPNIEVVKAAADEKETELVVIQCNPFDLDEISNRVGEVLRELEGDIDEIVVNYTGGSANLRFVLGLTGIALFRIYPTKLIYAVEYPGETKIVKNNVEKMKDIYRRLNRLI